MQPREVEHCIEFSGGFVQAWELGERCVYFVHLATAVVIVSEGVNH
jgi:hypothetical protein